LTVSGHGIDIDVLKKAGVESADALVVVTNGDNTNIMVSQIAKQIFKVPRVVARIYDPRRTEIYQHLGLDIISGTTLVASMIRDKLIDARLSGFFVEASGIGTIKFLVPEKFNRKTVGELNQPGEFLIGCIVKQKDGKSIIPSCEETVETGDSVIGVVKTESIKKIAKLFEGNEKK